MESRYARLALPSQILMPWSWRVLAEVLPLMNQRSSAMTARRKTRFVVRSGRMRLLSEGLERVNFSCGGAKMEVVPVPVLKVC